MTFVHVIRKRHSMRFLSRGSLILIYIREIWKKGIFAGFMTKGAISRHLTPRNQKSLRGTFFMSIISNTYPASGHQYHSLCQERFVSFFYKNRLFGDNRPRLCFGGASFSAMVVLLVS